MAEEINYDDDLFFIITRIQLLKNGLMLNLDSNLKEYYLNDLVLIDKNLVVFQEKLTNNHQLIKLSEYMHTLSRAESMLVAVINKLLEADTPIGQTFVQQQAMLETLATRQSNNALALIERLKKGVDNFKEMDILSEEELTLLISAE